MSYYQTPGAPYVPQQPVNPYGGMGTVGLATPLPTAQMQQAQQQRPQPAPARSSILAASAAPTLVRLRPFLEEV